MIYKYCDSSGATFVTALGQVKQFALKRAYLSVQIYMDCHCRCQNEGTRGGKTGPELAGTVLVTTSDTFFVQ